MEVHEKEFLHEQLEERLPRQDGFDEDDCDICDMLNTAEAYNDAKINASLIRIIDKYFTTGATLAR